MAEELDLATTVRFAAALVASAAAPLLAPARLAAGMRRNRGNANWRGNHTPDAQLPHVFTLVGWSDTTTRISPGRSLVLRSTPPYLAPSFLANA